MQSEANKITVAGERNIIKFIFLSQMFFKSWKIIFLKQPHLF